MSGQVDAAVPQPNNNSPRYDIWSFSQSSNTPQNGQAEFYCGVFFTVMCVRREGKVFENRIGLNRLINFPQRGSITELKRLPTCTCWPELDNDTIYNKREILVWWNGMGLEWMDRWVSAKWTWGGGGGKREGRQKSSTVLQGRPIQFFISLEIIEKPIGPSVWIWSRLMNGLSAPNKTPLDFLKNKRGLKKKWEEKEEKAVWTI